MNVDQSDGTAPPSSPPTPPMHPYAVPVAERRSTWPTALGVIAIVLGALAALGGCWGSVSPFFIDAMLGAMPTGAAGMQGMEASFEMIREWRGWIITSSLLTGAVAVLLLVSGIGLLKRRRWAVTTTWCWAILKVLLVLGSAVFQYQMQQDQFEAMSQQMAGTPGMGPGFGSIMSIGLGVGIAFTIAWGWALPVFMMIWFSRSKIKDEVASWA